MLLLEEELDLMDMLTAPASVSMFPNEIAEIHSSNWNPNRSLVEWLNSFNPQKQLGDYVEIYRLISPGLQIGEELTLDRRTHSLNI